MVKIQSGMFDAQYQVMIAKLILLCPVLAGAAYSFSGPVMLLSDKISKQNNWILLVFPFLILMLWSRRDEFSEAKREKSAIIGGAVMCLAALLQASIGSNLLPRFMIELSPFLFLIGAFFAVLGWEKGALLLWPAGYLVFFLIIIPEITPSLIRVLQISSTAGSWFLLHICGLDVKMEGISLIFPNVTLDVNKSCSGINQTVALLAFAFPLAWIRFDNHYRRLLLVLLAVPLSVIFNIIRITLIGFWNYKVERFHTHGPFDVLLLPLVYPVLLIVLVFLSKAISGRNRTDSKTGSFSRSAKSSETEQVKCSEMAQNVH
ncbi:MAG TPA: exosortase/archaeosortase family protein [Chitinispirillaceae bacterium]|nr:exosortase/archaeosortase family protein [Chitinispirillaceae bacterium]